MQPIVLRLPGCPITCCPIGSPQPLSYMSSTPITNRQFSVITGKPMPKDVNPQFPKVNVESGDIFEVCSELSVSFGVEVFLPAQPIWQLAALYSRDEHGNYPDHLWPETPGQLVEVDSCPADSNGLHLLFGNIRECVGENEHVYSNLSHPYNTHNKSSKEQATSIWRLFTPIGGYLHIMGCSYLCPVEDRKKTVNSTLYKKNGISTPEDRVDCMKGIHYPDVGFRICICVD